VYDEAKRFMEPMTMAYHTYHSLETRIGNKFIYPGIRYGGSCFPKDVKALARTGRENGHTMRILEAVEQVNDAQKSVL